MDQGSNTMNGSTSMPRQTITMESVMQPSISKEGCCCYYYILAYFTQLFEEMLLHQSSIACASCWHREHLKSRNGRNVQIGSVEYASGHTLTVPLDRRNVLWERSMGTFYGNVLWERSKYNARTFSLRGTFLWNVQLDRYDVTQLGFWACVMLTHVHTDDNKMAAHVGGEHGGGEWWTLKLIYIFTHDNT